MKLFILKLLNLPNLIISYIELKRKKVIIGKNFLVRGRIYVRGSGKIIIGDNVQVLSAFRHNPIGLSPGTSFSTHPNSVIKIGNNVGISNCVFSAIKSITIEDDVLLGGGVQVFDNDFHSINYSHRMADKDVNISSRPILIKQGAFIGTRAIITKGSIIGKRSVIGAGAVVSGEVPDDEIWAGNPAKFVKRIN